MPTVSNIPKYLKYFTIKNFLSISLITYAFLLLLLLLLQSH
jgi:hypothetical protein